MYIGYIKFLTTPIPFLTAVHKLLLLNKKLRLFRLCPPRSPVFVCIMFRDCSGNFRRVLYSNTKVVPSGLVLSNIDISFMMQAKSLPCPGVSVKLNAIQLRVNEITSS
jgi:hypothetical protein